MGSNSSSSSQPIDGRGSNKNNVKWIDVSALAHALLGTHFPHFSNPDLQPLSLLTQACEALAEDRSKDLSIFSQSGPAAELDADAILRGDPAARSKDEVILAYPGFFAIALHRFSHELWKSDCRLLSRMLSEYAHSRTGVDIHPGAKIGSGLCIDHGTGIVIGETTEIGNNVKLYQGVTLGALSVRKKLIGKKRHPTLEDDVTVYANATILGGDTVIGQGSVIGGSVWLTQSVPAHSTVFVEPNRYSVTQRNSEHKKI